MLIKKCTFYFTFFWQLLLTFPDHVRNHAPIEQIISDVFTPTFIAFLDRVSIDQLIIEIRLSFIYLLVITQNLPKLKAGGIDSHHVLVQRIHHFEFDSSV